MNWYYSDKGQQAGPITAEDLVKLYQGGVVTAETPVWRDGLPDWLRLRDVMQELNINPNDRAAGAASAGPEAVCVECGRIFPAEETIRHGNVNVCASCKPVFLQKLSEGAAATVAPGEMEFAGFWTRFAAMFLDGLIVGFTMGAVNMVVMLVAGGALRPQAGVAPSPVMVVLPFLFTIVNLIVGATYEIFMIGRYGATLGKKACKIKVVMADGQPLTYMRSFARYFAKMLSSFTCLIGYIIAGFDREKRALHDHICSSRVVRNNS